jgi:hypothetical protein
MFRNYDINSKVDTQFSLLVGGGGLHQLWVIRIDDYWHKHHVVEKLKIDLTHHLSCPIEIPHKYLSPNNLNFLIQVAHVSKNPMT